MNIASKQQKEIKRSIRYEVKRLKKQKRLRNKKLQSFLICVRIFIAILFVISFVAVERLYNNTFIHLQSVLLIGVIPGVIITLIFVRQLKNYLYGVICFGYIFLWVFLMVNGYGSTQTFKVRQRIDDRSLFRHHHISPWVTVYYAGLDKDVHFSIDDAKAFDKSTHLILTLRRGYLGYFIIESKQLD